MGMGMGMRMLKGVRSKGYSLSLDGDIGREGLTINKGITITYRAKKTSPQSKS